MMNRLKASSRLREIKNVCKRRKVNYQTSERFHSARFSRLWRKKEKKNQPALARCPRPLCLIILAILWPYHFRFPFQSLDEEFNYKVWVHWRVRVYACYSCFYMPNCCWERWRKKSQRNLLDDSLKDWNTFFICKMIKGQKHLAYESQLKGQGRDI